MDGRSMQFQKYRECIGNWGNNQGLMITIFSRRLENGFLLLFFYDLELENRKSKSPCSRLLFLQSLEELGEHGDRPQHLRPPRSARPSPRTSITIPFSKSIICPRSGGRTTQEQIARKLHLASGLQERIMASKSEVDRKEPVNEQMVANMYTAMRSELNQIYSKITELEMEASEHSLVINAIQPLDHSRRCYRMIGGVLVERTIKEVLPAVQRNKEGIEEVITRLNEALETKKKEIADFEAKYKIRIRKADSEVKDEGNKKEAPSQGVLVGPAASSSE